jgi:hypothetical protein
MIWEETLNPKNKMLQKVMENLKARLRPVSTHEKFPRTENFPKISLLEVENFQLQNFFSDGKFVSANHI